MALLQAAVVALAALIICPGLLFYFDTTPKIVVLLAGTAALLVCVRAPVSSPRARVLSILLLLYAASLALSASLSPRPSLSFFGSAWRRFGAVEHIAVLFFAWTILSSAPHMRTILRAVAAAGALTSVYGILQYFGVDPFLPAAAYHVGEGLSTIVRPPATLGYVSYFATWLLFVAFLSMALAAAEKSAIRRRLAYATAALAVLAMLLTGTRAAILGLAAGLAVWLYRRGLRIPRRAWAAVAVCAAAGVAFYFSPWGLQLRSRARWFADDPWGGARPALWRDSVTMASQRPFAGYGPETFESAFPRFQSRRLARQYPDFAHESPHNIFLDAFVSQGVPGLFLLAAICAVAFWTAPVSGGSSGWIAGALAAGVVSQQFTVFTVPTALMFYTTLALLGGGGASGPPPRILFPLRIAAALALLYFAARFAVSDRSLELVRQALDRGDPQTAAAQYAAYQRWRPPGPAADLWYSRAALSLAQKSADGFVRLQAAAVAYSAAQTAVNSAEAPSQAWYNLATLCAVRNDPAGTERSLRAAIAAAPDWFKPHWTLAQLLLLEGRIPEARQEAALAADLDGGKHAEVAATFAQVKSCCK